MLDEFVNLPVDRRADVNENITFVLRTWLVTIRCSVCEREWSPKKGGRNYKVSGTCLDYTYSSGTVYVPASSSSASFCFSNSTVKGSSLILAPSGDGGGSIPRLLRLLLFLPPILNSAVRLCYLRLHLPLVMVVEMTLWLLYHQLFLPLIQYTIVLLCCQWPHLPPVEITLDPCGG